LGRYFFAGAFAGAGGGGIGTFTTFPPFAGCAGSPGICTFVVDGALLAGALFAGGCVAPSNTDVPRPAFRVAMIESDIDVIMNSIADMVVAFDNKVAEPLGPKAVWEPMPPKAPARSAAFPLCSRTTMIKNKHTITCTINKRTYITLDSVYKKPLRRGFHPVAGTRRDRLGFLL
jgi:hypothetical protein